MPPRPADDASLLLGGIDAGGTSFVCGIGRADGTILRSVSVPTSAPRETLDAAAAFYREAAAGGLAIAALGIACFGPLERDPASPAYGELLATPKAGWSGASILTPLRERLGVPVAIDTDVNAAALAEGRFGAAKGLSHFAYVTVGTGIGVGVVSGARLVAGLMHPELGHIRPPRASGDEFPGLCPFHGNCLEGLASGPALAARFGTPPASLPDGHPAWEMEAFYLAHLANVLILAFAPERIVFGGGVGLRPGLVERIRQHTSMLIGNYASPYGEGLDEVILRSPLAVEGVNAGVLGGIMLAEATTR